MYKAQYKTKIVNLTFEYGSFVLSVNYGKDK